MKGGWKSISHPAYNARKIVEDFSDNPASVLAEFSRQEGVQKEGWRRKRRDKLPLWYNSTQLLSRIRLCRQKFSPSPPSRRIVSQRTSRRERRRTVFHYEVKIRGNFYDFSYKFNSSLIKLSKNNRYARIARMLEFAVDILLMLHRLARAEQHKVHTAVEGDPG